jgi:hypothetical protein
MTLNQSMIRNLLITFVLFYFSIVSALAAETRIETIGANNDKAVIIFADNPLKAMTEIPFAIELHQHSGEVIKDAELELDLTMPSMPMTPNNPKAMWQENAYRGTLIFTMAGAWQVNVEIKRPGVKTEKIIFDIEMVITK